MAYEFISREKFKKSDLQSFKKNLTMDFYFIYMAIRKTHIEFGEKFSIFFEYYSKAIINIEELPP